MGKNKGLSSKCSPAEVKAQLDKAKADLVAKMSCKHENLVYIPHKFLHAYCPSCKREFMVRDFDMKTE